MCSRRGRPDDPGFYEAAKSPHGLREGEDPAKLSEHAVQDSGPDFDERSSHLSTSEDPELQETSGDMTEAEERSMDTFPIRPMTATGLVHPEPSHEDLEAMALFEAEANRAM